MHTSGGCLRSILRPLASTPDHAYKSYPQPRPPILTSKTTDWETSQTYIKEKLTLKAPLKTDRDIEDYVHHLVHTIQQAA
jgi:hypothetical protein